MPNWITAAIVGVGAGLAAAAVMNRYQAATARAFGQDEGDGEPATVKAADAAARAIARQPVPRRDRAAAGNAVHYVTGAALGVGYVLAARRWPIVATGFGTAYGLTVALALDDVAVPAFGWGAWPWNTPANTHLYGLTAHAIFGATLEGARRVGVAAIG